MADLSLPKLGSSNIFSLAARKSKRRKQDPATREEPPRPSLLGKARDIGLSGLAIAGNILDIPGSMVRDTIGGKNPFDQLLTPTSGENRLTGRDLLRQGGLIGGKDTWGNWAGGLAAEIALDPTTYLTFGGSALTKGGQVAKAAGLLDDATRIASQAAGKKLGPRLSGMTTTLDDLIKKGSPEAAGAAGSAAKKMGVSLTEAADKPLRGLVGIGLPFQRPMTVLGTGKTAQKLAGALDIAGNLVKQSPLGRVARQLFDYSVKGVKNPITKFFQPDLAQELAEKVSKGEDAARTRGSLDAFKYSDDVQEVYKSFREHWGDSAKAMFPDDTEKNILDLVDRTIRLTGEMPSAAAGSAGRAAAAASRIIPAGLKAATPDMLQKIEGVVQDLQKNNLVKNAELESWGGSTAYVQNYMPRRGQKGPKDAIVSSRLAPTMSESQLGRHKPIRDVPAQVVNEIVQDAAARGPNGDAIIQLKYGDFLNPRYGEAKDALGNVTTPGSKAAHAEELWKYIQERDAKPIFESLTPDDQLRYAVGSELVINGLKAIQNTIAENLGDTGVNVRKLFEDAGMNHNNAMVKLEELTGIPLADLERKGVPQEVANAVLANMKMYDSPPWAEAIGKLVDTTNRWFKTAVTMPFPAHHSRNLTGGQLGNALSGYMHTPKDVADYAKFVNQSRKLMKNPDKALMRELIAARVFSPESLGMGVESTADNLGAMSKRILQGDKLQSPLNFPASFQEAQDVVNSAGRAQKVAGLAGKVADIGRIGYGTVVATGERVARQIEFLNRVPMYLYLKSRGYTAEMSASIVNDLQVDYSKLAPFEKSVMRRLVPFYSWQRKMAPVIFRNLLERPGGAQAQTIRAINRARKPDEVTPDYVAETAAIPAEGLPFIGQPPAGTNRYITGLGLPLEAPLQYLGGGVRGAGLEALSQMNPLVKGPLEWATGQSFFQRDASGARDIEDLDPTIGRLISNVRGKENPTYVPRWIEAVASNTPLTRVLTSARVASDPRKGIAARATNLLTGMKVADVSPRAQDAALQDRANALLKQYPEAREFSSIYVPKDRLSEMSPRRQKDIQTLLDINKVLSERAKIAAAKRKAQQKSGR